ncbi:MAG: HdeD family acid-resistance protein [Verrucomicrobiota bacterium]|jgi:uncharacterized membrane protein HdeD (DUF308 family)
MNESKEINREVGWSIVLSVLLMVAGVLAIIVPPASGIAVTILVGWLLVFCGAAHLAYAWQTRRSGGLWWGLLLGVLYILAGGYMLLHPMAGLASLTLVLVASLLMGSILEFILAFQLRPLTGSGWLLLDGIVSVILAILIGWTWPGSTRWVIGTLVGISMLFSGITRLMLSITARRMAHAFRGELHEPEPGAERTVEIN